MAMETERKISIAKAIIEKAIEVSDKTKHDVFVDWAPHVQWVEVDIYLGGWKKRKNDDKKFTISFNRDTENVFQACMARLNELLTEAGNDFCD